jgi:hypothetical protein
MRASPRGLDRPLRLFLVPVSRIAGAEVRERHRDWVVLHLPDVTELMAEEILVAVRLAKEDRVPGGVAVEAAEPGQTEEKRCHEYVYVLDPHGPRIEVEPVESGLGALESV